MRHGHQQKQHTSIKSSSVPMGAKAWIAINCKFVLLRSEKKILKNTLDLPPTQDASHNQDWYIFSIGNPHKPLFATVAGSGVDPKNTADEVGVGKHCNFVDQDFGGPENV